ncbi:MAG: GlcNAc-PI de-N-acetylase [Actinomycetia bacterium]|nr:GlcNAc-PI de-N-acetylase [Actinomycetes bacterium]
MATLVTFHAHPDDEVIATGGLMANAAAAGHRVVLVLATRGEQGEPVEGILDDDEHLHHRRSDEAEEAARILGVERVEFLEYVDSGMMGESSNDHPDSFWRADVEEAAGRLAKLLSGLRADVLTIYDDHGGYGHPDHIQVHRVGSTAARMAGTEGVFEATMNRTEIMKQMAEAPDLPADFSEDEIAQFGTLEHQLTHGVRVGEAIDLKRQAMAVHRSQISEQSFFLAMEPEPFAVAFGTEWFIEHGATDHSAGPRYLDLLPGLH